MRTRLRPLGLILALFQAAWTAIALASEMRTGTLGDSLLAAALDAQPVATCTDMPTQPEALALQARLVAQLETNFGKIKGYKAALTNPSAQQRFGITHPIAGFLLEHMLLTNGATMHHPYTTRPLIEGDLVVRVGSEAIMTATTRREALAALDAVLPFIELPHLPYATNIAVNAALLTAANAGARAGILGDPLPLAPTDEWEERLAAFTVELTTEDGSILATGRGDTILGHPLNAVLWLRDALREQGRVLKPGDLLSLGSLTPLLPTPQTGTVRARYTGLGDEVTEVTVTFTSAQP